MRTTAAVTLSVLVLLAGVTAVPLVGMAQTATTSDATGTADGGAGNGTVTAPGEQFAGVVGVQGAEVEGEIETRRLETRLERADTAAERASIVAETTNNTSDRLEALRERRERIEAAHENGTLSDGQYRARLARLAAEIRTAERVTNRSAAAAESLPETALEANGVNRTKIEELRRSASELGGGAVAEAAREIGGPGAASDRRGPLGTEGDDGQARPDDTPDSANESRGNSSAGGDAGNASVDDREGGPAGGEDGSDRNEPTDEDGDDGADGPEAPTETRESGDVVDGNDDSAGSDGTGSDDDRSDDSDTGA